ncbi:hypothetical protein IQ238_25580 [Pleurocapsales cyanobacterium LEGE 06147]|nr:hypothetical protein [Pleurocapsales cyanobacterium LEGE 06147]
MIIATAQQTLTYTIEVLGVLALAVLAIAFGFYLVDKWKAHVADYHRRQQ